METWQQETLSEPGECLSVGARGEPHLVLALECERPWVGPARHSLFRLDEVLIGRGPVRSAKRERVDGQSRLTLCVPDGWMSSSHARLRRSGGTFVLEDQDSRNGSSLNGAPVSRGPVGHGDVIQLGHTLFQLAYDVPTPEGAPTETDASALPRDIRTLHPGLAAALAAVDRVASSNISILVQGETGTGKEVLAHAIHASSGRGGAFVAINCGALPQALVESQLFGYVKGAFSGAVRDEPGLVRAASGGTLFLDEVADLPKPSQVALLRVLQEREVLPVGATRPVSVDLRVVSATHRSLEELAARGEFRSDLLARLTGYSVTIPPLRERPMDLGLLIASALNDIGPASEGSVTLRVAAGRALLRYPWPFNVRELRQCLTLGATLAKEGVIEPSHLPPRVASFSEVTGTPAPSTEQALSEEDARLKQELVARLQSYRGNVSDVARSFGRARTQIHRWMARFDVDAGSFRKE